MLLRIEVPGFQKKRKKQSDFEEESLFSFY